jgi:hypothetical protein
MSIRSGKTRGQKRTLSMRQTTGDDSQSQDIYTLLMLHSGYRPTLPHEQSTFEFDCPMDTAIVMGQPDPYRPRVKSPVGNQYGPPVGCLERTTADDDTHVEWQVSPDGGDDVDHGDDSHDIPQPRLKGYSTA